MPNTNSSSSRGDSDSTSRSRSNGHSRSGSGSNSRSTSSQSNGSGSSRSSKSHRGSNSGSSRGRSGGNDSILAEASRAIRPVKRAVSSARRSVSQRMRNLPSWTPYALGAIGIAALIYGAFQLDSVRDMFTSDVDDDLFSSYDSDESDYSSVGNVRSSVGNSF